MGLLDGKFAVLGVSGGISAYRSCELVRLLRKDGCQVQVVLTEAAAELVGPKTFQALSGRPVEVGQGGSLEKNGMPHIELGSHADVIVVAPATANTLAKLAHGLADNLLSTIALSSSCPIIVAPAMNHRMWNNTVTQSNVERLARFTRIHLVGPGSGELACGEEGEGRMEEPMTILEVIREVLSFKDLKDRRVLITAGPTREPVDPVRFLSNRSSGRMGYALAAAACRRGADVVLVTGPTSLKNVCKVKTLQVLTAADMAAAVHEHAKHSDLVLMAAAVSDFRPKKPSPEKIKKGKMVPSIELERTEDILTTLGKEKHRGILVGFAAEWGDPVGEAKRKLEAKHADLVVANDVSLPNAGFDVETNLVYLVDTNGVEKLPLLSKEEVADRILDHVVEMLPKKKNSKGKS